MNHGWIYIIKNNVNKKVYIGQTLIGVEERFKQHMKPSNSKKHYKIYKAINKLGAEKFYCEILEGDISEDIINDREIYWIEKYDSFKNGYNSNPGGLGRSIYSNLDVDYIVRELQKGKQVKELAKEFNVNASTINRSLKRIGISSASSIQNTKVALSKSQKQVNKNKVVSLRKEGKSVKEISLLLNCDSKTIRRILHSLNINVDMPRYDYSNIDNKCIINDKLSGMKVKEILAKYNISYGYYCVIWKEYRTQNANSNDYPDRE